MVAAKGRAVGPRERSIETHKLTTLVPSQALVQLAGRPSLIFDLGFNDVTQYLYNPPFMCKLPQIGYWLYAVKSLGQDTNTEPKPE